MDEWDADNPNLLINNNTHGSGRLDCLGAGWLAWGYGMDWVESVKQRTTVNRGHIPDITESKAMLDISGSSILLLRDGDARKKLTRQLRLALLFLCDMRFQQCATLSSRPPTPC